MTPDYRRRESREAEVLAEISINRELPVAWISANRGRATAIERLIAAGKIHRLPCKHPSVLRFGVKKESIGKRLFGRWLS